MICPDCKWESPLTKYKKQNYLIYIYKENEKPGKSSYPIIMDYYINQFGKEIFREIHWCPNCKREFEQEIIGDKI
jgi:hypothetical protein